VRYSQILVENRRFNLPYLYLAPPLGVIPLEFRRDLWYQKTRRIALSCGIKTSLVGSLDLSQSTRVADIQADGHNYDSQDRASKLRRAVIMGLAVYSVAWAEAYLRTKWRLDPSSRLVTIDMGRKEGAAVPLSGGGSCVPI